MRKKKKGPEKKITSNKSAQGETDDFFAKKDAIGHAAGLRKGAGGGRENEGRGAEK